MGEVEDKEIREANETKMNIECTGREENERMTRNEARAKKDTGHKRKERCRRRSG